MTALKDPLLAYSEAKGEKHSELVKELFARSFSQTSESAASDAYSACKRAADEGSSLAMCICSRFCRVGFGTRQSNEDSFKWAERATESGFAPAHYELGKCYEEGIGVTRDLNLARKHYQLAADGGFGFAACHLATMCHDGKFGMAERMRFIQYAEQAYELGEPLAPMTLAIWYENGDGVIRNDREAATWYVRAAELGNFAASLRLSMAYAHGELGLKKDPQMAKKYESLCGSQSP